MTKMYWRKELNIDSHLATQMCLTSFCLLTITAAQVLIGELPIAQETSTVLEVPAAIQVSAPDVLCLTAIE